MALNISLLLHRLAVEREVDKGAQTTVVNLLFDESSNFLIYSTLLGIKIVNLTTNRLARSIGKLENLRILSMALFQVIVHNECFQLICVKNKL